MGCLRNIAAAVGLGESDSERNARMATEAAMGSAAGIGEYGKTLTDFMGSEILPRYQQQLEELYNPAYEAEQVSRTKADFAQGEGLMRDASTDQARRMGVAPDDLIRHGTGDAVRGASALAGATDSTRQGLRSRRIGALGPGFGVGQMGIGARTGSVGARLGGANQLMGAAQSRTDRLGGLIESVGGSAGFDAAMEGAGDALSGGGGGAGGAGEWLPAIFAEGGYVEGPGDGMDDAVPASIDGQKPAALSNGEYVLPADVVQYFGVKHLAGMIQKARQDMAGGMEGGARRTAGGEQGGAQGPPAQGGARRMPAPSPQMPMAA